MGFLDRLRDGLTRTKKQIVEQFEAIVEQADAPERRSRPIDVETIEALEELLVSADVGIPAPERIVTAVQQRSRHGESLRDLVKDEIRKIFDAVERPAPPEGARPHVVLIVGVNGTGKTTTVGKLANLLKSSGRQPLVCAADTFRAAAVEQLEIWARRAGVDIVRAKEGSDPAAVVFDAIQSGRAKGRVIALHPLEGVSEGQPRRVVGITEYDRVAGGGLGPGSALLIGGDPGIGKPP